MIGSEKVKQEPSNSQTKDIEEIMSKIGNERMGIKGMRDEQE